MLALIGAVALPATLPGNLTRLVIFMNKASFLAAFD